MLDIDGDRDKILAKLNKALLDTKKYKKCTIHREDPKAPGGYTASLLEVNMGEEVDWIVLGFAVQSNHILQPNEHKYLQFRFLYKSGGNPRNITFGATLWGRPTDKLGDLADISLAKAVTSVFGQTMAKPYETLEKWLEISHNAVFRSDEMAKKMLEEREDSRRLVEQTLRLGMSLFSIPATGVMMALTVTILKYGGVDSKVWWKHWYSSLGRLEKIFGIVESQVFDPMADPDEEEESDEGGLSK